LSPIWGSWPCWNSTFGVFSRNVFLNAPLAICSMKCPSNHESISVKRLKTAKWPNRVGILASVGGAKADTRTVGPNDVLLGHD